MSNVETTSNISLWRDIKDSLAGVERDYTTGSISRAIILLSIPMVLEMLMESVFAVVDIFFVSQLGADAVATVGLTESVLTILYAVAIGLSMGTTAIVARRIGEKDKEGASSAAVQAIILGAILSIPISLIGIFYSQELLDLMGANENMIQNEFWYTSILFGTNIVIMLIFINNAIFRGAGDAAIAMRALWISNGINIVLDPILIFGFWFIPEYGIAGAAIATSIGRGTGVLYQLYKLNAGSTRIAIIASSIKADIKVMINLVRISMGGILQFIIATSSWIVLMKIMSEFGSVSVAGYTIAIRIIIFSILPAWGMSNAAATLVGQNLGAGNPERAAKSTWISAYVNSAFLITLGVIFNLFSEFFVGIFTSDLELIAIGAKSLEIISYGYLIYGFGMVMIQAFNGAGDTKTPTIINFFCFWLLELPLAYYLALVLGWNEEGVLYSIVIAETMMGIVGIILFKKGNWKKTKV